MLLIAIPCYGWWLLCLPILHSVFTVAAKLGSETRRGLIHLIRDRYGRKIAIACALLVVVTNMAMTVADLMAVTSAFSIMLNQPRVYFVMPVVFGVWYVLIFSDYRNIVRVLFWFSLPLFVYPVAAVMAAPSLAGLLRSTFLPQVPPGPGQAAAIVGLIGALLTPYVIVWQTASRREEEVAPQAAASPEEESHAGTLISVLLAYSVIVVAASALPLTAPGNITTEVAASALRPALGEFGPWMFAIGIVGAGLVALPVLVASLCYSVAEALGWKAGLNEHPWEAKSFYVLISGALLFAAVLNFVPISPVEALYLSQKLAGVLTFPVLVAVLALGNDRRLVRTRNTVWQNFWLGVALVALAIAGVLWLVLPT